MKFGSGGAGAGRRGEEKREGEGKVGRKIGFLNIVSRLEQVTEYLSS